MNVTDQATIWESAVRLLVSRNLRSQILVPNEVKLSLGRQMKKLFHSAIY